MTRDLTLFRSVVLYVSVVVVLALLFKGVDFFSTFLLPYLMD